MRFDQPKELATTSLSNKLDSFVVSLSKYIIWVNFLLLIAIIVQVFMRYVIGRGMAVLEEVQWHLYAIGVMFALSYSMVNNAHVRLDIAQRKYPLKVKAIVEILGILFLLLPFTYIIIAESIPYVLDSWRVGEGSDSPGGLPFRYAIKAVMPLSFILLAVATVSRLIRAFATLTKRKS